MRKVNKAFVKQTEGHGSAHAINAQAKRDALGDPFFDQDGMVDDWGRNDQRHRGGDYNSMRADEEATLLNQLEHGPRLAPHKS